MDTIDKIKNDVHNLNREIQKLTEKQLELVLNVGKIKKTQNQVDEGYHKDVDKVSPKVVGLNEYQQRIKNNPVGGGWYHFFGVPNNEEGKLFISLIDKYLNRDIYGYRARGRGNGSYAHSLPSDQADSFVVYLDEKKKGV